MPSRMLQIYWREKWACTEKEIRKNQRVVEIIRDTEFKNDDNDYGDDS